MIWTVCGMYEDTAQVFTALVEAPTAAAAMAAAAAQAGEPAALVIVGAIEGEHDVAAPGDDSGTTAYAVDLAGLASE